jgi:hypothetical protein
MKRLVMIGLGVLSAGLPVNPAPALGQEQAPRPEFDELFEFGQLGSIRNLRPSGMPVIPAFDGWIDNGDGSADLCFGYKSLNLEERRDIPLGPDNFIEPAQFDGGQPTFFLEVPPGWMRHYCVFNVRVPIGSEPVTWTLRHNGYEYTTPGHTGSPSYLLDNTWHPTPRGPDADGGKMAPLVEFIAPEGSRHIGRAGGGARAEASARVGAPLTLTVAVTQPDIPEYEGDPKPFNVYWYKYRGPPGEVQFSQSRMRLQGGEVVETKLATTMATFSAAGSYVLLVQVLQGSFESQCCWTNGYVEVTVRE